MCCKIFIVIFFLTYVQCEVFPTIVDIDANCNESEEILKNYYRNREPNWRTKKSTKESYEFSPNRRMSSQEQEIGSQDTFNFQYPKIEFSNKKFLKPDESKHEDNYVFVQQNTPNSIENDKDRRKTRFKFYKLNRTMSGFEPIKVYVEKVSKPNNSTRSTSNKYEEAELTTNSAELSVNTGSNTTSDGIHRLLKDYFLKLYSQKYNNSKIQEPPTISPCNEPGSNLANCPETKFGGGIPSTVTFKKPVSKTKSLSLFTIVQFNNTQCNATSTTGSYIGVCYTATQCNQINSGMAVGNCAAGYGVCCVALGTCGGNASQNCSYFQSPNYPDYYPSGSSSVIIPTTMAPPVTTINPSPTPDPRYSWSYYRNHWARQSSSDLTLSCVFSITKSSMDVNRMRIDFLDLELASPTNGTCQTERLIITGQGINSMIPAICGYNTGQSIYVDVSMLSGPLQLSVLSSMAFRKRFNIRICQFSGSCLEPDSGCLQYYTGVTGTISSFNYDQSAMFNRSVPGYFNNLNYGICIRREAGYCSITFTNVRNGVEYPFQLINTYANGTSTIPRGTAGVGNAQCPNDYIVVAGERLCGDKFNDGSTVTNVTLNAAVTDSNSGPIVVRVRTNPSTTGAGFKLFYTQNRCNMN